jgi:hypothetical protein
VDVGNGHGNVELDDTCTFLTFNLAHLKRMELFTKSFCTLAMEEGAEIAGTLCLHPKF